jgi:flagellar biosynthesis/type III secretory pathway protein FliH
MSHRIDEYDVRVADVIAFDAWPDEQKQIARAAVAFEAKLDEAYDEGYTEGFDAGVAGGRVEGAARVRSDIEELVNDLQLVRQSLSSGDSRYLALGEVIGKFNLLIAPPTDG